MVEKAWATAFNSKLLANYLKEEKAKMNKEEVEGFTYNASRYLRVMHNHTRRLKTEDHVGEEGDGEEEDDHIGEEGGEEEERVPVSDDEDTGGEHDTIMVAGEVPVGKGEKPDEEHAKTTKDSTLASSQTSGSQKTEVSHVKATEVSAPTSSKEMESENAKASHAEARKDSTQARSKALEPGKHKRKLSEIAEGNPFLGKLVPKKRLAGACCCSVWFVCFEC